MPGRVPVRHPNPTPILSKPTLVEIIFFPQKRLGCQKQHPGITSLQPARSKSYPHPTPSTRDNGDDRNCGNSNGWRRGHTTIKARTAAAPEEASSAAAAFNEARPRRMGGQPEERGGREVENWDGGGQSYLQSYLSNHNKNRGRFS